MATIKRTRSTKSAKPSAPPEVAKVTTQTVDIQDAIRARAYQLYEERGHQHGNDFEDWVRAEAEVLARFGARTV